MTILFECGSDNDGYPTCQGDGSTCGPHGKCRLLWPDDEILAQEIREQLEGLGVDDGSIDETLSALAGE